MESTTNKNDKIFVQDHLKNKFNTVEDMCKHYGITVPVLCIRLNRGYTLKESLVGLNVSDKSIYDSKGRRFNSFTDICKAYGVDTKYVKQRMSAGMGLEEALNIPYKNKKSEQDRILAREKLESSVVDHQGNMFYSNLIMCIFWNVPVPTFKQRLMYGMSLKEALTTPVDGYRDTLDTTFNIMGRTYLDIIELNRDLSNSKINKSVLLKRLYYLKWDKEVVAVANIGTSSTEITLDHVGFNGKAYYRVSWEKPGVYVTARDIVGHYRPDKLSDYDKYNPTGKRNLIEHLDAVTRMVRSPYGWSSPLYKMYRSTLNDYSKLRKDVPVISLQGDKE